MKKKLTALLLAGILLQGCAANMHTWKETLPERDYKLSSNEKEELYRKYSIQDFNIMTIRFDTVKTGIDNNEYEVATMMPMVLQVSPKSEKIYKSYTDLGVTRTWTSSVLAAISLTPVLLSALNTEADQNTRFVLYGATLASLLVTMGIDLFMMHQQSEQLTNLKDTYNSDLKKYLELETVSLDDQIPAPSLKIVDVN